jgi:hypothetical protein
LKLRWLSIAYSAPAPTAQPNLVDVAAPLVFEKTSTGGGDTRIPIPKLSALKLD